MLIRPGKNGELSQLERTLPCTCHSQNVRCLKIKIANFVELKDDVDANSDELVNEIFGVMSKFSNKPLARSRRPTFEKLCTFCITVLVVLAPITHIGLCQQERHLVVR
jgi:hypothetical protein